MLDPLPIGEEEPKFLKCENCGMVYNDEDELHDYNSIEDSGLCTFCVKL